MLMTQYVEPYFKLVVISD